MPDYIQQPRTPDMRQNLIERASNVPRTPALSAAGQQAQSPVPWRASHSPETREYPGTPTISPVRTMRSSSPGSLGPPRPDVPHIALTSNPLVPLAVSAELPRSESLPEDPNASGGNDPAGARDPHGLIRTKSSVQAKAKGMAAAPASVKPPPPKMTAMPQVDQTLLPDRSTASIHILAIPHPEYQIPSFVDWNQFDRSLYEIQRIENAFVHRFRGCDHRNLPVDNRG